MCLHIQQSISLKEKYYSNMCLHSSSSPSKGPTSKERSLTYDSINFWKSNNSKQGQKEEPQRAKPVNYLEEKRSLLFWNLKFFFMWAIKRHFVFQIVSWDIVMLYGYKSLQLLSVNCKTLYWLITSHSDASKAAFKHVISE